MQKYIKKPIEIEAIQWTGFNLEEIKSFVGNTLNYEIFDGAWQAGMAPPRVEMKIKTLEGEMQVSVGDYIIKGVKGEFYPCKPDIFEMTYEAKNENVAAENETETLKKEIERLNIILDKYAGRYGKVTREKYEVTNKVVNIVADLIWEGESEKLNIPIGGAYFKKQEFIDYLKKYIGETK